MPSYYDIFMRYIRSACFTILRKYCTRGVIGFAGDGIRISQFGERSCTLRNRKRIFKTSLHHFRFKIDTRDWPWHISQRDDALLLAISHRAVFERDWNDKRRAMTATFAGSISSSCRFFLVIVCPVS